MPLKLAFVMSRVLNDQVAKVTKFITLSLSKLRFRKNDLHNFCRLDTSPHNRGVIQYEIIKYAEVGEAAAVRFSVNRVVSEADEDIAINGNAGLIA